MSSHVTKHVGIISKDTRSTISTRYKTVTKASNSEFWNSTSETAHSLYVGSYGRGTAVDTSDIDILLELPQAEYERYNAAKRNGQSRLLQAVKEAIQASYPRSDISADGQIVKITFSDGMKFELLPAFLNVYWWGNQSGTYIYPDTNMGGNWQSTNPKAEQDAMRERNNISIGLLFDTCKHIRYVRDTQFKSYHLSGIVIDSFVYAAIGNWHWTDSNGESSSNPGNYEKVLLNYYDGMKGMNSNILQAPGSAMRLDISDSIFCLGKVLNYMIR